MFHPLRADYTNYMKFLFMEELFPLILINLFKVLFAAQGLVDVYFILWVVILYGSILLLTFRRWRALRSGEADPARLSLLYHRLLVVSARHAHLRHSPGLGAFSPVLWAWQSGGGAICGRSPARQHRRPAPPVSGTRVHGTDFPPSLLWLGYSLQVSVQPSLNRSRRSCGSEPTPECSQAWGSAHTVCRQLFD